MGAYSAGMFSDNEIIDAIYVQQNPFGPSGGSLLVNIPSLMPDAPLPGSAPKVLPEPLDSSCFGNAKECKPTVSKKISSPDYFVAQAPNFPYKFGNISFGAKLKVQVRIRDTIEFKLVSEELDPSW